MNAKAVLAVALFLSPLAGGAPAWASADYVTQVVLKTQFPVACAGGYHQDADGNCQPNIPAVPTYCASLPGYVYQPAPWGWDCVPAPKGY